MGFDDFKKEFEKRFGKQGKGQRDDDHVDIPIELTDGMPPELADLLKQMASLPGVEVAGGVLSGKTPGLDGLLKNKINEAVNRINSKTKYEALEETLENYLRAILKYGDGAKHLGCEKIELHEKISAMMLKDAKVRAACVACYMAGQAIGSREAALSYSGILGAKFISLMHASVGPTASSLENLRNAIYDISDIIKDYPTFSPNQKENDRIQKWKSPFKKLDKSRDDD